MNFFTEIAGHFQCVSIGLQNLHNDVTFAKSFFAIKSKISSK